jgi:fatty acid elongase 3
MQILQFVIDLFAVYFGSMCFLHPVVPTRADILIAYQHYAYTYYKGILPSIGNCAGSESAALFGCGLLTSYLGLFINFYIQTYKSPAKNGDRVANKKANGTLSVPKARSHMSTTELQS